MLSMAEEDRWVRAELSADGSLFDGYHPTMQVVHDRNAARLTEIIERHGWPGRDLVGEDGSRAAWLVLQHAIGKPALQRRGLVLLRQAVARGDVPATEVAMLEDRIAFFEGRPQRYGTQYDWNEHGELAPWPIEDEAGVDDRRREVGLPPLEENTRRVREGTARDGEPPPSGWSERQRKFEEWAKRSAGGLEAGDYPTPPFSGQSGSRSGFHHGSTGGMIVTWGWLFQGDRCEYRTQAAGDTRGCIRPHQSG